MAWSGFPLQPGDNWRSTFYINQIIDAANERQGNADRINPGTNIQSHFFWSQLQGLASAGGDDINPALVPEHGDFIRPLREYRFQPFGLPNSTFDFAGMTLDGRQGFLRRIPNGSGGYTEIRGGESHEFDAGFCRRGDYLGYWLLNDMYKMLNSRYVYLANQTDLISRAASLRYQKDVSTESLEYQDTFSEYDATEFETIHLNQFEFSNSFSQGFGFRGSSPNSRFIRTRHTETSGSMTPFFRRTSIDVRNFDRVRIVQFFYATGSSNAEFEPSGTPVSGLSQGQMAVINDEIVDGPLVSNLSFSIGGPDFPFDFDESTPDKEFFGSTLAFADLSVPGGLSFLDLQ